MPDRFWRKARFPRRCPARPGPPAIRLFRPSMAPRPRAPLAVRLHPLPPSATRPRPRPFQEPEQRGQVLKVAGERHAGPDEACKLITNFLQAETKMVKYVETNSARCGIPPQISEQLKKGHVSTEAMRTRVCGAAAQMQKQPQGPTGPSLSEVLGSAAALPEATVAKKNGNTFDTLSGNALTR